MTDFTDTPGTFAPDISRNMWSGYMNNLYDITPDVRLTVGIRYDGYNDFDSNVAPRGGVSWQVNKKNTLKFMYGEGYRIPTFAELYNTHILTQGNPNLSSESVNTQEFTWIYQATKRFNIKTTLFNNNYTDLITKVITASSSQYQNIGKVNTRGLELAMKYNLERGSYLKANYSYVHTEDILTGDALPDVAKHKANLFYNKRLSRRINWFNHIFIKGETTRVAADPRDNVAGYALYNTALKMKNVYKTLQLKLSINNVFNKKVYDPSIYGFVNDDYETKARSVLFNAQYKF
jgi:iron complex outermembrane receptor protein